MIRKQFAGIALYALLYLAQLLILTRTFRLIDNAVIDRRDCPAEPLISNQNNMDEPRWSQHKEHAWQAQGESPWHSWSTSFMLMTLRA